MFGKRPEHSPPLKIERWRRCLLRLCVTIVWVAGLVNASVQAVQPPPLHFEPVVSLNVVETLSFLQDKQGFIWLASTNGVYRHDGYRTVHYRHDVLKADSLPSDSVAAFHEDKQGQLWVATYDGIARFEPETGRFLRFPPPPEADGRRQNRLTRAMMGDGADGMWLATRAGLLHFAPKTGQFVTYRHDPQRIDSLPSDNVSVLARDTSGGLWVGNWSAGLSYLPKDSKQFQRHVLDIVHDTVKKPSNPRALLIDSRQRLWVGTDNGVFLWNTATPWADRRQLLPPAGVEGFRVLNIHEDATGQIWIGTQEAGLLRWDEARQTFLRYTHQSDNDHSLPSNSVSAVFVDRTQTLWVGTRGNGVSRVDLASNGIEQVMPRSIAPENFKLWNMVFSFAETADGKLWLGGTGGLTLVDLAQRKLLRSVRSVPGQPRSLSSNFIHHLYQQPGGPLWIATSDGLGRLNPNSDYVQTKYFGSAENNAVNRIYPGENGVLWLATGGAVIRYSPLNDVSRLFKHDPGDPDSLSPGANSTLLEDRKGNLWVGGGNEAGARGLDVMEKGSNKFHHYRHDPKDPGSLNNDIVTNIYEDGPGNIWIGTATGPVIVNLVVA